jgi:hypothetical protein
VPSIIPPYVYTLFASMTVGAMLIYAFSTSAILIKNEADQQELQRMAQYVATNGLKLIAATANNSKVSLMLDVPSLIGNQRFWVRLQNDSSSTWIMIGYGTIPQPTGQRVTIPIKVSASGTYLSGSGIATLECQANVTATYLELSGGY